MKNNKKGKLLKLKLNDNQSIDARYLIQKLQQEIDSKIGLDFPKSGTEDN